MYEETREHIRNRLCDKKKSGNTNLLIFFAFCTRIYLKHECVSGMSYSKAVSRSRILLHLGKSQCFYSHLHLQREFSEKLEMCKFSEKEFAEGKVLGLSEERCE